MPAHRNALPQLDHDELFLTDGGLETTLIFHDGIDLPEFASFVLLRDSDGEEALRRYLRHYLRVAGDLDLGLILETATWRASPDWGAELGWTAEELAEANRRAVELVVELREEFDGPLVVSGCVGPRGDGYQPGMVMTEGEAQEYHSAQINTFRDTDADLVTAITMTNVPEAIGVTRAATEAGLPVVISFTVETDGRLPTGMPLGEAIQAVDDATDGAPAYYMVNCAHPTHFADVLEPGAPWVGRLRGLRPNASRQSHAELDEAEELDEGDAHELGLQVSDLRSRFPQLNVLGGCCGTDHRHIEAIGLASTGQLT